MPIIKQRLTWKWFTGCHPASIGCIAEGREQCECKYHITDGVEQFSFEDFASAESKWCELTLDKPFQLGKSVWN